MNAAHTLNEHDPFDEIVIREMNGRATPEEIAYLKAHFFEHRSTLISIITRNQGLKVRLQAEIHDDILHEHELELKQRIAKAGTFIKVLESHLAKLNAYGKSHPGIKMPTSQLTHEEYTEKRMAQARLKGWGEAIRYFDAKLEEGLTREQAMIACIEYAKSENTKLRAAYAEKKEVNC